MKPGTLSISVLLQRAPLRQRLAEPSINVPSVKSKNVEVFPKIKSDDSTEQNTKNDKNDKNDKNENASYFQQPLAHLYYLKDGKLPSGLVKHEETLANAASRILTENGVDKFWLVGRKPIAHFNGNNYIMKAYSIASIEGEWVAADKVPIEEDIKVILSK